MASTKQPKSWFIELDLDADPEVGRDEAYAALREWHDGTRGFVRISDEVVEAGDLGEALELKLRLHGNVVGVRAGGRG